MNKQRVVLIKFPWSKEIYLQAGQLAFKYQMRYTYKKYIGWFFIAMLILGAFQVLGNNSYSIIYLSIILLFYWYITKGMLQTSKLKKNFEKDPFVGMNMEFKFTPKKITINSNTIPWSDISAVILSPKGFLLERSIGYPFVPVSAFRDDDDILSLKEMIDEKEIPIREIG